ncbi:PREDICTED: LOW QUALITY PROTEIN: mas-related G-protein coupled receptor member H-like [Nipponia nippon]|nr:PREDICTED: LOW QUALITY PROTEIN: mas-related G-protein coupled receptor member H-like [Nipponia nippon]
MELNQTSPPPTSPMPETDGDDPCRMDVTDMAIDSVQLLISLCGLMGNGAVLWLLGCRIRRNPHTLLSLMYPRSLFLLSLFSYNVGLYLLTAISIERCVSILYSSIRRPQHLSAVVCALLWALSIAVVAAVTSLCLLHDHEHCQIALISMYVLNFLIFAPPMVISNVILFVKVLCDSKRRQPKRLYIVIFLTVLFFLIFALPLSVWNFLQQFSYTVVPYQVVFLLACINSSINPFIYFLVGSCRRHCSLMSLQVAFQRVFEETGITVISS